MRFENVPEEVLELLPAMLRSPVFPVQKEIANAIGADQAFISRVMNREVKRVTQRVANLWEYARQHAEAEKNAGAASSDIDVEISSGPAVRSRSAGREKSTAKRVAPASLQYADEAISGVKAYLADGYDARLILEQIQVLRRAQHVRRPGRSRL